MMYSGSQYILLASLVTAAHAIIMVQLVDGSFVPWSLGRRGPEEGLPLRLTNHDDISYLTTVLMGTPFQEVQMAPSLSQNFISVASAPPGVSSNTYYNPTLSSSYTPPSSAVASIPSISGGNITGRFAGETCSLKALNSATFVYNAAIALTNSTVMDALYPIGARGVLGYGVAAPPSSPPNASLIPSFLPPNFTFAVCGIELNHMSDPVPDGIFTMGAVDPTAYTGDFTDVVVPGSSPVSWSIPFDSLSYLANGTNQALPGLLASVDIYHSVIQVPTDMASSIYNNIPGSQASGDEWSLPCTSTFPITLTFSGRSFTINERDTIIKLPDGTCRGVVTGGAQQMAKIGAPFLRNVYTQFGARKAGNGAVSFFVGFAAKNVRRATATTTVVGATATPGSAAFRIPLQDAILLSTLAVASIVAFML